MPDSEKVTLNKVSEKEAYYDAKLRGEDIRQNAPVAQDSATTKEKTGILFTDDEHAPSHSKDKISYNDYKKYASHGITELKKIAKGLGISGYTKYKLEDKDTLVEKIIKREILDKKKHDR